MRAAPGKHLAHSGHAIHRAIDNNFHNSGTSHMVYPAQSRFSTRNALLILVAQGSFTSKSTQNLSNRALFKSRYFILFPQPCVPVLLWFRSLTGNIGSPFSESQFCGSPSRLHIWTPTPLPLEKCHLDSEQLDRAHISQSSHASRARW